MHDFETALIHQEIQAKNAGRPLEDDEIQMRYLAMELMSQGNRLAQQMPAYEQRAKTLKGEFISIAIVWVVAALVVWISGGQLIWMIIGFASHSAYIISTHQLAEARFLADAKLFRALQLVLDERQHVRELEQRLEVLEKDSAATVHG